VVVHLWIASDFSVPESDGTVISQRTNLPWSGQVEISVRGAQAIRLALRIPGWASSGYTCSAPGGELRDGYLYLLATTNSTITLNFPLQPRKVYAHPKTGMDEICIMRGPLVYCIEDVDNANVDVDHVALVDGPVKDGAASNISTVEGVIPVHSPGKELVNSNWSSLHGSEPWKYSETSKDVVFVPFFLRMNRSGNGGMRVWIKRL
jgi:DUF1680 family protein